MAAKATFSQIGGPGGLMMTRVMAAALASPLLVTGCSGNGGNGSAAAPTPSTATITQTITQTPVAAPGLKAAVYAYSAAYLRSDGNTAYNMLSQRCQDRMSRTDFVFSVSLARQLYGPMPIRSYREETRGDWARVSYTYRDQRLDQTDEPWVFEGGRWRQDDCP